MSRTTEKPVAVKAFRFHLKETKNANELKYRRCKHNSKQQFGELHFSLSPPLPLFLSLPSPPFPSDSNPSGCGFSRGPELVAAAEKWSELRQRCQLVQFLDIHVDNNKIHFCCTSIKSKSRGECVTQAERSQMDQKRKYLSRAEVKCDLIGIVCAIFEL